MFAQLFRRFLLFLVRIFYPHIALRGLAQVRLDVPTIFVLNHPNGLIDPLVLMLGVRRGVSFLAKSTFWSNPIWRFCMQAFAAIPVYRQRDAGEPGGAAGDRTARNEQTFAQCRALLGRGGLLALFPEGTTHSASTLLPLKSGAARIALGAEAERDWRVGVQIVPVGLWYADKTHFRTSLLLVFGQPFTFGDLRAAHAADVERAVDTLTERIEDALDGVVLQAESAALLDGITALARWTAPQAGELAQGAHFERAALLLAGYERLRAHDPARLAALAAQARGYADALHALGLRDLSGLERGTPPRVRLAGRLAWQVVAALPALAGAALSFPYWFAGLVAERVSGPYPEIYGTAKLIAGALLITLAWLGEALIAGGVLGARYGVALLALAPALAVVALRWGETWRALREALRRRWLAQRRPALAAALIAQRQALASAVTAAAVDE